MLEHDDASERAILVHVYFSQEKDTEDLAEFESLVSSAGVQALHLVTSSRKVPHSKYFIGEGKVQEITEAVQCLKATVILFDHELSPSQERNIEHVCQCRVIGRTGLILDIFAQRARTHEGKLQVELAQLNYLSTRLVRGWTHLERQKGGIGLRGPGETQLETDRRLLRERIRMIHLRLQKVEKQREQVRRGRIKAEIPVISLVGYTNAGKSTLFNKITSASVYAADQLFATLDPTVRRIKIADVGDTVLTDTVGFMRHLPHNLIAAFNATLQETKDATLLLHVVDAADPRVDENIEAVEHVLNEINAGEIPILFIMNKIDLVEGLAARIERNIDNKPTKVWLSSKTGEGIDLLFQALTERLMKNMACHHICLPGNEGKLRSRLYQLQAIEKEWVDEEGKINLSIRIPMIEWKRFCKQEERILHFIV